MWSLRMVMLLFLFVSRVDEEYSFVVANICAIARGQMP